MKQDFQRWAILAFAGVLLLPAGSAWGDPHVKAGVDIGATGALSSMDRFVSNGAILSPHASYMVNDFLGMMGQLHVVAMPNKDRREPNGRNIIDSDATWALGGSVGPRVSLPLGGVEVYGTWQAALFTGLAPHSAITGTSWGFSTGGGANLSFGKNFTFGGFARYNRLYQEAHGTGDVRYATGGISFTFTFPVSQ